MTQMRSKIVSRQALNAIAERIGLDKHIIAHSNGNSIQKHIYGDAFEAMMGAVYLDQGYEFVNRLLINNIFYNYLDLDDLSESESDFKSRLIEWCQKNHHSISFRSGQIRSGIGNGNRLQFYATVYIDGLEMGHGSGESKKEAEQEAARSVSQGVSDEACASLLDKVDRLTV